MLCIRRHGHKIFGATRRERRDISVMTCMNDQRSWIFFSLQINFKYNYMFELRKIMPGTSGLRTRGSLWFQAQQESSFFQISVRNRICVRNILSKARLYHNSIPRTIWNDIIWTSVHIKRPTENCLASLLFTNCYLPRERWR